MNKALNILHIDDSAFDRQLVRDALEHENGRFTVTSAASREEFEALLTVGGFDLVLTDFNILGFEGLQVIDEVHERYADVPVIIVTGTGSEEIAVEAMKRGAVDYVIKTPRHIRRLPMAIDAAMELAQLRTERLQSEAMLRKSEELLRAFANALPDLAFIMDEDGRYLELLSTPSHLLYTAAEHQRGKLVHEVLPKSVADPIMETLHRTIATGAMHSLEYQLHLPAGEVWFEARISPMERLSSEKALVVFVARNITDRKIAEQALEMSRQILEKRNRDLTALYEIGHSLSTILDFDQICRIIYREFAQRLFSAPHFSISLYDETSQVLSLRFMTTNGQESRSGTSFAAKPNNEAANEVIRTRRAQIIPRPEADVKQNGLLPTAALYAPLISSDLVIGVMVVQSPALVVFQDADMALVETITNQCAVALANALLYEKAQQEIYERRQAEHKLARERNLLRTLIDNVPDYIYVIDREGRFIASNTAHANAAHCTPHQLIGRTAHEIFPPDLDTELHHDDRLIMASGEPLINKELMVVNDQGMSQWFLATKVTLHNEQGGVIGLVGISRDISKRKRDEEALRASEEHLHAVVSGTPVILFALDKDGVITLLQGQGLERLHADPQIYVGKSIFEINEAIFPDMREHFLLALDGKESGFVYTLADNVFAVHYSLLRDNTGAVSEVIGVANDITERLKAERLQIEMEKEQEIIALKERFLATASHDFRTPLTIIKLSEHILETSFDRITPEARIAKLQQIRVQANRMTALMDDVLTMSQANAGKLDFQPEPIALRSFCEQIWDDFRRIAEKTHTLNFEYRADLEDVVLDPNLVQQILVNLLSNAIKYTPKDGHIGLEVTHEGDDVCFRVSDDGIGIPAQDQTKLFQPFHRALNTKGIEGTGLGLSIVKSYVEVHGGRISVESSEGKGTRFLVRIPCQGRADLVGESREQAR